MLYSHLYMRTGLSQTSSCGSLFDLGLSVCNFLGIASEYVCAQGNTLQKLLQPRLKAAGALIVQGPSSLLVEKGPLDQQRTDSLESTLSWKDWGQDIGVTNGEDEIVRWHHQPGIRNFSNLGVSDGRKPEVLQSHWVTKSRTWPLSNWKLNWNWTGPEIWLMYTPRFCWTSS